MDFSDGMKLVIFAINVSFLLFLVTSVPSYDMLRSEERHFNGPCPMVWGEETIGVSEQNGGLIEEHQAGLSLDVQEEHRKRVVDCKKLMHGDSDEVTFAKQFNWCVPAIVAPQPSDVINMECTHLKKVFGYSGVKVTDEESKFPLAFSILTYEDFAQSERLLRVIYKPHNLYCVHVDAKADSVLKNAFIAISKCLPNVLVPRRTINVHWAEYSVLAAELLCMQLAVESNVTWKYYINLTGREFPLKTNQELVRILQIYDGANDIDGNMYK